MTYYFIGADSSVIANFRDRLPELSGSSCIENISQLQSHQSSDEDNVVYFADFNDHSDAVKDIVISIRKNQPLSKIVYICQDYNAQALKTHQRQEIGGDAYLALDTDAEGLWRILDNLMSEKTVVAKAVPQVSVENRLEDSAFNKFADFTAMNKFREHQQSHELNSLFKSAIEEKPKKAIWQSMEALSASKIDEGPGETMSTNEKDLPDDDLDMIELEFSDGEGFSTEDQPQDEGLDLSLGSGVELSLSDGSESAQEVASTEVPSLDSDLDLDEGMSLDEAQDLESSGELTFDDDITGDSEDLDLSNTDEELAADEVSAIHLKDMDLGMDMDLSSEHSEPESSNDLTLSEELPHGEDAAFNLDESVVMQVETPPVEFSNDAMEKLKEIDEIMEYDATKVGVINELQEHLKAKEESSSEADEEFTFAANDQILDQPLVSDDLDLDSINFASEEVPVENVEKKKKKEVKAVKETRDHDLGQDLKEISGAYSGEMERLQATISNLRIDREELLAKIDKLEEEKVLQNRQTLSLRAELDEKKIELSIIRKKLNEELSEMKDRLKLFDEKRLILEEKNRYLMSELDKTAQKNKIDVKKVQMRERELEQKLELLKADAETQIRNRDLKILELKRKLDSMEFDMESISQQEKKSVESRFELEDKLEKAIKTLRNAITVLEDETDRTSAISALKKNIDM